MIVDEDLLIRDDEHMEAIHTKVMDSAKGEFCGQHSCFEFFNLYAAISFLKEFADIDLEVFDGGKFDNEKFNEVLKELPDHVFQFALGETMRLVVADAETLVFLDN
jgi:hypothetical protein